MKSKFMRLTALVLAFVICLGTTAMATSITDSDKATIKDPVTGAAVTFVDTTGEKIEVTYESDSIKEGQLYLVMVVAGTKDETTNEVRYVPTKDTILYINQTVGADSGETDEDGNKIGKIVFGSDTDNVIYPSAIKDSAILIYGSNVDGTKSSLVAAIIDAKYILGDVDGNGTFNIADVTLLLQYIVGLVKIDDIDDQAANVDGFAALNVSDVTKMLRVLVDWEDF